MANEEQLSILKQGVEVCKERIIKVRLSPWRHMYSSMPGEADKDL
jgi:hypothetical protein